MFNVEMPKIDSEDIFYGQEKKKYYAAGARYYEAMADAAVANIQTAAERQTLEDRKMVFNVAAKDETFQKACTDKAKAWLDKMK